MFRRHLLLTLALGLPLLAQSDQAAKPIRVLFIGNSYTYYNNLPKLVEAIAESEKGGPRIETESSLSGGKSLRWHWENHKALEAVRRGGWDFVVLQEHSTLGKLVPVMGTPEINNPAEYFAHAEKFHAEIAKVGAKTLLYATWARDGFPEQQWKLDDAFARLSLQLNAPIVPAGLAWTMARMEAPGLKLYMPDRSHPTAVGSYLNALLFYRVLTQREPKNPPETIVGPRRFDDPKPATLVHLPWSDVNMLNQFAQRAVSQAPARAGR